MSARHLPLLPVAAILFGLTACTSAPSPAPISAATPSSAPTSAASPSSVPTSGGAPATSDVLAKKSPGSSGNCPSAKALEKLADLPKGWHFIPSSVECWKGWATAEPEGPTAGDGVYLFRYRAGTGWRYHSQGSAYECKDLGINEPAPFCSYP